MQLSIIIPAVAAEILKKHPEAQKKCHNCSYPCSASTKFICLGMKSSEMAEFIKQNPQFVKKAEERGLEDFFKIDDFDLPTFDDIDLD